MTCNPQIHTGWSATTSCYAGNSINGVSDNFPDFCLYPIEQATIRPAYGFANCLETHPIGGRLCALPIAAVDTCCAPPILALDTVWSIVGTIFCGMTAGATCCCWSPARTGTRDFACSIAQNVSGLFMNLCMGPVLCASGTAACCAAPEVGYTTFWKTLPCIMVCFPLTCGFGVYNLCKDPEKTGKGMKESLDERYPTL